MRIFLMRFKSAVAVIALSAVSILFPAAAKAYTNTLKFQGVTFNVMAVAENVLQLQILNAATGGSVNWVNIRYIGALEIEGIGSIENAYVTSDPGGAWTPSVTSGLAGNALGCGSGGTPGACFSAGEPLRLTDSMVWQFGFDGENINFGAPHLKVQFLERSTQATKSGDLLSRNIPAIPERVYAMMLAGLGLMGFVVNRRRQVGTIG